MKVDRNRLDEVVRQGLALVLRLALVLGGLGFASVFAVALHYGSAEFSATDLEKGINLAELQTTNRRLANAAAESMLALQVFDRLRRDSVACGRPSECAPLDAQEETFYSAVSVKPVVFHVDLRQEAEVDSSSDAERHGSGMMNAAKISSDRAVADGVKVLFLGNSITLHGSVPEIGWTNVWGMAASAAEKDYVHLVTRGIERETGRKADVRVRNLAAFERDYRAWDIAKELADMAEFDPDYLVIALGENVPDLKTEEDRLAYRKAFKGLLDFFMGEGRKVRPNVVVRGVFWPNAMKDFEMAHVASDYAVPFVQTDLGADVTMTARGLFWHDGVQGHPGDRGMQAIADRILEAFFPTKSGYEVRVNGKPVKVRPIRISAVPFNQWRPGYQRPVDQTEIAGMVSVEAEGVVDFRVKVDRLFKKAVVRPLSAGIKPRMDKDEILFKIPKPGYYVLELDGKNQPLEMFVEPRRSFTEERKNATVIFGPGLHEPKIVKLKSHDRVYIDRDAVVRGSFQMTGVEDVRIFGTGVISGARNRRDQRKSSTCAREGQNSTVRIIDSKNVLIDGPIVLDSPCWMVEVFNSSDLELSHLKVTGAWRYNTDGIDICNSQRVRIHDSYVHSFDDSIVLKGIWAKPDCDSPVEDVRVERCVCWCAWGRTLEIGLETWAPYYRNIVFDDCDLIHNCGGALSVHLGGPGTVEDVLYRNIRIEYDAANSSPVLQTGREMKYGGKAPWSGDYIRIENEPMFKPGSLYVGIPGYNYPAPCPLGTFQEIRFENIAVTVEEGAVRPGVHIKAEQGSSFGEIKFQNVTVNGVEQSLGFRGSGSCDTVGVIRSR